jgi:hypothetical protein
MQPLLLSKRGGWCSSSVVWKMCFWLSRVGGPRAGVVGGRKRAAFSLAHSAVQQPLVVYLTSPEVRAWKL